MATRKQHLAALRHYFDGLVTRHAIILNPALSVRGERYQEGGGQDARDHRARHPHLTGRHRYRQRGGTPRPRRHSDLHRLPRDGAVATLKRGSFYHAGDQLNVALR